MEAIEIRTHPRRVVPERVEIATPISPISPVLRPTAEREGAIGVEEIGEGRVRLAVSVGARAPRIRERCERATSRTEEAAGRAVDHLALHHLPHELTRHRMVLRHEPEGGERREGVARIPIRMERGMEAQGIP